MYSLVYHINVVKHKLKRLVLTNKAQQNCASRPRKLIHDCKKVYIDNYLIF